MIITSLLDNDLYKFTMQQVVFHRFSSADVEYRFKCRDAGVDLTPFAGEIRDEIDAFCRLRFAADEIDYLRSIRYMHSSYVESLPRFQLDPAAVEIATDGGFALTVRGNWYQTILFEVPILAIVNEVYFRNTRPGAHISDPEGEKRLVDKCRLLSDPSRPFCNVIEFGTRRRYSAVWHDRVLSFLKHEIAKNLIGTSNVALARKHGLRPHGTMAHEYLQACQVFAPLADFQRFAFETWMQEYRGDLGIALSDVVGIDAFLNDFDRLFALSYAGARHDSGDPFEWGEKLIAHYERLGIDPATKSAVFSDGLDIPRCQELAARFGGRIRTTFGIGTNFTNDFSFPPLNIVIKMVRCNGWPVAKLSDTPGKEMCDDPVYVAWLRRVFQTREALGRAPAGEAGG